MQSKKKQMKCYGLICMHKRFRIFLSQMLSFLHSKHYDSSCIQAINTEQAMLITLRSHESYHIILVNNYKWIQCFNVKL